MKCHFPSNFSTAKYVPFIQQIKVLKNNLAQYCPEYCLNPLLSTSEIFTHRHFCPLKGYWLSLEIFWLASTRRWYNEQVTMNVPVQNVNSAALRNPDLQTSASGKFAYSVTSCLLPLPPPPNPQEVLSHLSSRHTFEELI